MPDQLCNWITKMTNPWAKYRFDSLQVLAEKRIQDLAKSGTFLCLLCCALSKSFEASHRPNPWNLAEKPIHELSAFDKPQTLAISGLWDLPIGWGRPWFNQVRRLGAGFLNGWSGDWILTDSSWYPVNQPDAIF